MGFSAVSMQRKVLKPFKLSDTTDLPVGSHVTVNSYSYHHDPSFYPDPDVFDPFQFSCEVERGESQFKHSVTTCSSRYLAWGYGRSVWHFAALELKYMLAHVLTYYDVRMPEEGVRPSDQWFGHMCSPDREAHVLFRKRVVEDLIDNLKYGSDSK